MGFCKKWDADYFPAEEQINVKICKLAQSKNYIGSFSKEERLFIIVSSNQLSTGQKPVVWGVCVTQEQCTSQIQNKDPADH